MKHLWSITIAFLLLELLGRSPAGAQGPAGMPRVALPFDLVDTLDGAKFNLRVPANWNGTLLVYLQGAKTGTPPPVPVLMLQGLRGSDGPLEDTLLSRGYALAASEIANTDWEVKASVQDHFALTTYFKARIGDPKRVILWGASLGGPVLLRLMEENPRSFDGGIAMCPCAAGMPRQLDQFLDFDVAYAVALGWPDDAWGPVENLRPSLNFSTDVMPKADWPKADGSNRGAWEFIRLVNGVPSDAFWKTDPRAGYTGYFLQMFASIKQRVNSLIWSQGPAAQNLDRYYTLTPDEKAYLAGLGIRADDLLMKMNTRYKFYSSPSARDYIQRFGDVHGTLTKPVITVHTTLDTMVDVRSESAYRQAVDDAGSLQNLAQAYVTGLGHCNLTTRQLLATLAALEHWLDTGVKPDASFFPESEGFDNQFVPPPWPY